MPSSLADPLQRGSRSRAWTRDDVVVLLALAAVTSLTFLPALWNDFVAWDDAPLLVQNPEYRGLGPRHLAWMLTTVHGGHYIPLTWVSFGLDYVLWGMNPAGYHLTNLLLHVLAVLFFYAVVRHLLRRATAWSDNAVRLAAAVAALVFAIHPLRAESVAWVTDRKDVLSGALFLLTVLLYLRSTEAQGRRRHWLGWLSVAAYLLALASKSSVVTLPLALMLLDAYPLDRLSWSLRGPDRWSRRLGQKTPYLVLGAAGVVMAYLSTQILVGPTSPHAASPWIPRALTALHGLWFYLVKTAIPAGLSPLYEAPPHIDPWDTRFVVSAAGVLAVSLLVLSLRKRWPAGLAAWTYYVILLIPVAGLFPLGSALVADRYSYLPCLGWALLVGAGAGLLVDRRERGAMRPWPAPLVAGAVVAALATLGTLTWQQVQIWRDTESVWRHAVSVAPDCFLCRKSLGEALLANGAPEAALEHFRVAAALRPTSVGFRVFLGVTSARLGRWPEAVEDYRQVLGHYPERTDVRHALAIALHAMGRDSEAIEQLREALRTGREDADIRLTLGVILNDRGDHMGAAEQLQRASELLPRSARARLGLVKAYAALGQNHLARQHYEVLRTLDPQLATLLDPRTLRMR